MRPCSQCSQCSHLILSRYLRHAAMHRAQFVGHVVNVVNDFGLQNPGWKRETGRGHVNLYCIYTQYINFKTYSRIDDYIDYKQHFPLWCNVVNRAKIMAYKQAYIDYKQ